MEEWPVFSALVHNTFQGDQQEYLASRKILLFVLKRDLGA